MATMGRYCKAYPISRLREFSGWSQNEQEARREKADAEVPRELTVDSYLYLQEDYTVTDSIFKDENIIFDDVTPEWIAYCGDVLKFEIPVYDSATAGASGDSGRDHSTT